MKKVITTIILLLVLCCTSGCISSKKATTNLSVNPLANETIVNYSKINPENEVLGEYFSVKIIEIKKVNAPDMTFYRYIFAFSPTTDMEMQINEIELLPPLDLQSYYLANESGLNSFAAWNSLFEKIEFPKAEKVEELTAFVVGITINNLGNEIQQMMGIDDCTFDEAMKRVRLQIKYNDYKKEILELKYSSQLINFEEIECLEDQEVLDILEKGYTNNYLRPLR